MGIKKRMQQKFNFDFCCHKGQISQQCDGKNFCQKFVISGSVSTMQQCIKNNISKNKH